MLGIPVLEKYRYLLYSKWYDILILLNSVFHTLLFQIVAQPVKQQNYVMDQTDETLLTHPKLTNTENSRSEIWHYFAYKTDKVEPKPKLWYKASLFYI